MRNYSLRFGAVFGFLTVVTTLGVHLIPIQASTFEESVMLYTNATYLFSRWWIIFHCICVFFSMTGVFIVLNSPNNIHAKLGLMSFAVFSWAEITRMLFSLTYLLNLRRNYIAEADETLRAIIRVDIQNFSYAGEGLFTLFILGFALGNLFYGIEISKAPGLGKWVGYLLIFWSVTGFVGLFSVFYPISWLDPFFTVFNVTFQPAVRGLTAYWLWKQVNTANSFAT